MPQKGHDILLRAVAQLPESLGWHLMLVGDGDEEPRIRALVETLGIADRVRFVGVTDHGELQRSLRARRWDLAILPSVTIGTNILSTWKVAAVRTIR